MLMMMSRPASELGGTGERAFLAFKLHRFFSGAGHVYATLRGPAHRWVTLDGQRFETRRTQRLGCTRSSFAEIAGRNIIRSFLPKAAGSLACFRDPSTRLHSTRKMVNRRDI